VQGSGLDGAIEQMNDKDIRALTALELGRKIKSGDLSSPQVTAAFLEAAVDDVTMSKSAAENAPRTSLPAADPVRTGVNAYISLDAEKALADAEAVQKRIRAGEMLSPLAGVPVAIKDNICVQGGLTTAASRMLDTFRPPYDATVIEKLRDAGAVILGKTNLDEFAMGGSTETSAFGITRNPWDLKRVPGGSSGGSAAAVAAGIAPYAIGSDTGGSIRQPCGFCNLTGVKPTYGSVSRYGLLAYASSLDQIGPVGLDAADCAAILSILSGSDPKDSTSVIDAPYRFCETIHEGASDSGLKGLKIGLPENYFADGLSDDVRERVLEAKDVLEHLGAEIVALELPLIDYAVPAYYIIACAEASSNLSRYDGVKYGFRSKNAKDIFETYTISRSEGFGTEVKRRIMLGSFVLSSGYFDAYYKKALQVRGLIKSAFDAAFEQCDFLLSPISPTVSYRIGAQISDPLAMYMADVYTVSVNLAGVPAVALPCGFGEGNMPVGMQFIGRAYDEGRLLNAAKAYQGVTDFHKMRPESIRTAKEGKA
jgi:aspartyl-tRNA(Asn)/glutamyl-tRNA(Gln) amidotransferase subunit A